MFNYIDKEKCEIQIFSSKYIVDVMRYKNGNKHYILLDIIDALIKVMSEECSIVEVVSDGYIKHIVFTSVSQIILLEDDIWYEEFVPELAEKLYYSVLNNVDKFIPYTHEGEVKSYRKKCLDNLDVLYDLIHEHYEQ
jgi:hypothetical protein